jgi:MFS transporter, FHS family, L-fucose permease
MAIYKRKIAVSDDTVTSAHNLTVRQSLVPNLLGELLQMTKNAKECAIY